MAKHKSPKAEHVLEIVPIAKERADNKVITAIWWFGVATLALSVLALLVPEWRFWALHQFAFMHLALAVPLLLLAALLLSPYGIRIVEHEALRKFSIKSKLLAVAVFGVFMLLSVHGSLLGDGQLCLTRLAHIGDMAESNETIPPGRFFSQKEPGTMLLHEGAFRVAMELFGPDIKVEKGRAGQQARVERQLKYRVLAMWCYRILSAIAGVLLVLILLRFVRARKEFEPSVFLLMILSCGGWLSYFGYVENYAWVTLAMISFLIAGLKAMEPPRMIPLAPILLFMLAVGMHYMAIVMLPALVYLLWTMHFEQRDQEQQDTTAQFKRMKVLVITFLTLGLVGYLYIEGWKGWISVLPLLPMWVHDGYALFSIRHFIDLINLAWWACGAAVLALVFTRRSTGNIRANNQENFLLLSAGASAFFASVFSPNLGMARDWDIVTTALWPTLFYGAWRLSQFEFDAIQLPKFRASLLAIILLILVPAVVVQTVESSAIAHFRALLNIDASRSGYGWENLALYYQKTGEIDKRVEAWEKAVASEKNPRYMHNLAEAYKLSDKINDASYYAMEAARADKEYAGYLFYYATAQARRGELTRARDLVDTALLVDSTVAYGNAMKKWISRACLVDSVAKTGDIASARSLLTFYSREDPNNSYWPEYAQKLGK